MKKQRKQKNRQGYCRIAIHTSPSMCKLQPPQMEALVNSSLTDAFLPPLVHVSATPEKADAKYNEVLEDPYWQSEYRELSVAEIVNRYDGLLPIAKQYQMDSSTLVSCVKVTEPIRFERVVHFEVEADRVEGMHDYDASDMFFCVATEKDAPSMRSWDDIPWDKIGVVPKDIFYNFIKILLTRLEVILLKEWKAKKGFCVASGYDQDIVQGTYFDIIKAFAKHPG